MPARRELDERFKGDDLDLGVWTPADLPAWSSRAQAAATYAIAADGLHLTIPPEHPLWCEDLHDGALRVSAVQSANWSGPLGSTRGQQPFRDGLVVREEQPTQLGCTPRFGRIEVECRARIGPRSMFSAWMVGIEDEPERCGEICLMEVFGDAVAGGATAVGTGIHPFRDARLREEFSTDVREIDVAESHSYAIEWGPDGVEFLIDDERGRATAQSPRYPMQLIIAVFDFPDRAPAGETKVPVPELVVSRVFMRAADTQGRGPGLHPDGPTATARGSA